MDKNHIAFLKRRFPRLFYKVAGSITLARIVTEFDRFNYFKCLLFKKPYFGTVMLAGQTWESRKPHMRSLIEAEIFRKGPQNGFHVLEMGTWAGDSAILWADTLKRSNVIGGIIFCVDSWEALESGKETAGVNKASLVMKDAARRGKIFKLFLHNVKTSGHENVIKPLRGLTHDILPGLKLQSFDFVYVDASHLYSHVRHDLKWALKLVRPGGVICGDDLELQKHEIDIGYAEQNKEKDTVICPSKGTEYHPGVTLAVDEIFGNEVTCQKGFWHVRR